MTLVLLSKLENFISEACWLASYLVSTNGSLIRKQAQFYSNMEQIYVNRHNVLAKFYYKQY